MTSLSCLFLAGFIAGQPPTPSPPCIDRYGDPLPDQAVMRLGTVKFRVANLAGVGFRKTGELVAFSNDPAMHVWPLDGSSKATVTKLSDELERATFSPDARFAVSGLASRKPLAIWDLSGDKPEKILKRDDFFSNGTECPTFSPDGSFLAIWHPYRKKLYLANVPRRTWSEIELTIPPTVRSFSFSSNGKYLAVTSENQVQVIDTTTGKNVSQIDKAKINTRLGSQNEQIRFATPAPDGSSLAVIVGGFAFSEFPSQTYRLLSLRVRGDGDKGPLTVPFGFARWVTYSPDGKTIFFGGELGLREWDPVTGQVRLDIAGPASGPVAFSSDGNHLASHGGDAILYCNAKTGKAVHPDLADAGHTEPIYGIQLSPDGKLVATNTRFGNVRVWQTDTGRSVSMFRSRSCRPESVAFLPDSRTVVVIGDDQNTPSAWDAYSGKELRRFIPKMGIFPWSGLRLSPDGKTLVTSNGDTDYDRGGHALRVSWDVKSGRAVSSEEWIGVVSPDGMWAVEYGNAIHKGAKGSYSLVSFPYEGGSTKLRAFSSDSRVVALYYFGPTSYDSGREKSVVLVFDLTDRTKLAEIASQNVSAGSFTADARYLAVVAEGHVVLWEVATASAVRKYPSTGNAIRFMLGDRRLIGGQQDGSALIWDVTGTNRAPGTPAPTATEMELSRWWDALTRVDAAAAHTAGWELSDRPAQAIAFLRDRLKPIKPVDDATVRKLVRDLDAVELADREKAEKELMNMGDAPVGLLQKLQADLSKESEMRLKRILAAMAGPVLQPGDRLRQVRAVAILERIGTADAKKLLDELARGAADARVTKEAKISVGRLTSVNQ
jgi:WD40 repeat protein